MYRRPESPEPPRLVSMKSGLEDRNNDNTKLNSIVGHDVSQ